MCLNVKDNIGDKQNTALSDYHGDIGVKILLK